MMLPSYLRVLRYLEIPVISIVESMSYVEHEESIEFVQPWGALRDTFEYVACMEEAVQRIDSLPSPEMGLSSVHLIPARYDSAGLVFFAQAALDNLAVWLNSSYDLGLFGNNISFYKSKIYSRLSEINTDYQAVFDEFDSLVKRLNAYRMAWLHRQAGGARLFFDKMPGETDASPPWIGVPLCPNVTQYTGKRYLTEIERIRSENGGEWVAPVSDFVHDIKEGVLHFIIRILEIAVEDQGSLKS